MRNGYIYLIQLQSVSEKYELRVFDARQSISKTSKLCVVYILKLPIECYDIGLGGPNRQCVAGEVKQPPHCYGTAHRAKPPIHSNILCHLRT